MSPKLIRKFKAIQDNNGTEWVIEMYMDRIPNPNRNDPEPIVHRNLTLRAHPYGYTVCPVPNNIGRYIIYARDDEQIKVTTSDPAAPTQKELNS